MTQGSSLRRKVYRLRLGENRKSTVFSWIGSVTVGVMNFVSQQRKVLNYTKGEEGAEKSSRRRRGRRGGLRGKRRAREGKSRCSQINRPKPSSSGRLSKRGDREESWSLKISALFAGHIQKLKAKNSARVELSPMALSYRNFARQVSRMNSLLQPISYRRFVYQSLTDSPWLGEPDICLRMSVVHPDDVIRRSAGTNIRFIEEYEPVTRRTTTISMRDPMRKKTRIFLCTACGRRSPTEMCACQNKPSAAVKKERKPARVRRCGCKVGAKCPH